MRILSFDIGIKNLAYCDCDIGADLLLHKNLASEQSVVLHEWDVLDISGKSNSGNTINEQTPILLEYLSSLFHEKRLSEYDVIAIENQPSLKNPIMKSIQMVVFTFFHMMKIKIADIKYDVQLISASNKIKVLNFLPDTDKKEIDETMQSKCPDTKKGYKYNKTLSKLLMSHFVDKHIIDPRSYSTTNAHNVKKKDDLADCFLQACIMALQTKQTKIKKADANKT